MILVFARDGPIVDEQTHNNYRNHYLARRQVSSEGWTGSEIPRGIIGKLFGGASIVGGLNNAAEVMFFVGRFYRALGDIKGENGLDPAKYSLKIMGINGYRFPGKFLHSPRFKDMLGGFECEIAEHNGREDGFAK